MSQKERMMEHLRYIEDRVGKDEHTHEIYKRIQAWDEPEPPSDPGPQTATPEPVATANDDPPPPEPPSDPGPQ